MKQHPPGLWAPALAAAIAAGMALLAAAPAIANVVEQTLAPFLSREQHVTPESPRMTFSSFKPGTFLFLH